jgi:hypothetical protein
MVLLLQFLSIPVAPGPKGSIEGIVTSTDGRPLAGAEVSAFWSPPPMGYNPNDLPRATTDREGRFVLREIGAGGYRILANAPGYAWQEYGASVAGNQGFNTGTVLNLAPGEAKTGITIRLVKDGIISGRITSITGSPLLGMEVFAVRKSFDQNGWPTFTHEGAQGGTNDRGEYRITGLPPGQYYVRASSRPTSGIGRLGGDTTPGPSPGQYTPTYYPSAVDSARAVRVEVKSGVESGNIDVALPRLALFSIRGRVVDPADDKPPARAFLGTIPAGVDFVSVISSGSGPYRADGTFELTDIAPGMYWVNASLPGPPMTPEQRQLFATPGADFSMLPISPQGKSLVTVINADVENVEVTVVRDLQVTGSVSVEGQAITPAELNAIKVEFRMIEAGRLTPPSRGRMTMSPDGRFTFGNFYLGEYRATLSGLPRSLYIKEARLGSIDALSQNLMLTTSPLPSLDFVLAKGGDLVGTVTDSASRPVANQEVVLVPAFSNRPELYKTGTTDGNGRFAIQGIAPGDYRAYAWKTMERFQYFDSEFVREFSDKGTSIQITASSEMTAALTLIQN